MYRKEYVDQHNVKYVVEIEETNVGKQIRSEIHTPWIVGKEPKTREVGGRKEILGLLEVTTTVVKDGETIASGFASEERWMDIFRPTESTSSKNLSGNIVDFCQSCVSSGSGWDDIDKISTTSGDGSFWGAVDAGGNVSSPASGSALQWIDVWS